MENNKVEFTNEDNEVFEMTILKEFEHNKKKYAILMEDDCDCGCSEDEHSCHCDDDCDCGCSEDEHSCHCDDDCEKGIYIFEITKDEKGNEVFAPIKDEKEFESVVKKADKVLYEDE